MYNYTYGLHDDIWTYEYDSAEGITYITDNVYDIRREA